ncbi:alpha/beta hydrolase, partial [Agreia sp.]|uniref:alpha/beta hydrolase n=1 Tax=Agreia sp. TaxID=1872416 RepID=UPI0035BC92BC
MLRRAARGQHLHARRRSLGVRRRHGLRRLCPNPSNCSRANRANGGIRARTLEAERTVRLRQSRRIHGPSVSLRSYRPRTLTGEAPALFWIHGGGFVQGDPVQDERSSIDFARTLGITVVGLRYRLGPEHPAPAAIEDAYAGLSWLAEHAAERGVDAARIAIGGASAGGGL